MTNHPHPLIIGRIAKPRKVFRNVSFFIAKQNPVKSEFASAVDVHKQRIKNVKTMDRIPDFHKMDIEAGKRPPDSLQWRHDFRAMEFRIDRGIRSKMAEQMKAGSKGIAFELGNVRQNQICGADWLHQGL
jgi:hypothetical protein